MLVTIISSILSSIVIISVLGFLVRNWILARLKSSIRYEYQKEYELYKRELDLRQKVELVAELLAEYIATPVGKPMTRDQRTKLNKLSFQASLWLPSELAVELGKRLQNKDDAKSTFDLILTARHLLTGDDSIQVTNVTFWGHEKETDEGSVIIKPTA